MAPKTQALYMTKVNKETSQKLGDYLVKSDFSNDTEEKRLKQIEKMIYIYFKMGVNPMILTNHSKQNHISAFGELLERKVCSNDSLCVQLCNNLLRFKQTLTNNIISNQDECKTCDSRR